MGKRRQIAPGYRPAMRPPARPRMRVCPCARPRPRLRARTHTPVGVPARVGVGGPPSQ